MKTIGVVLTKITYSNALLANFSDYFRRFPHNATYIHDLLSLDEVKMQ